MIEDFEVGIETELQDAEFDEELHKWLGVIADTCVAHMKYIEDLEDTDPSSLNEGDYGILELERGFLVLYALQTKGGLPINGKTGDDIKKERH